MVKSKVSPTASIPSFPASFLEDRFDQWPVYTDRASDEEEQRIILWTRGDYHHDARRVQYENRQDLEELYADAEKGLLDDTYNSREAIDEAFRRGEIGDSTSGSYAVGAAVEAVISRAPNFGGNVVRGIRQGEFDYKIVENAKAGDTITFGSTTSWSPYIGEASRYVYTERPVYLIVNAADKSNARITRNEVAISGGESFDVVAVRRIGGATYYYLR